MEITKGKTRVGFIGLGVMGHHMAGHILSRGIELHVFTRTKSKAEPLIKRGAIWEDSVAGLARKSDLIISIVGFPEDVRQVYSGPAGILENASRGSIAMDMTTSDPELAAVLFETGRKKGVHVLDAPVSGGDLGAQNASLSIMVGGEEAVFKTVLPILEIMGKNIVYQGKAGAGQHTKMANQMAIAAGMLGVCEALAYVKQAGLDPETVLDSIGAGAAGSWSLNNLGPRILKGDFAPGFFIKHFIKDMDIASKSSKTLGLDTPGLDLALSMYRQAAQKGLADDGTQGLYKLYEDSDG